MAFTPWRRLALYVGGAVLSLALTAPPLLALEETPESFPAGPGREEAFFFCTACHGGALVKAQGMSRERWDESFDWMTERHGMPALEGKEREVILDYLANAFPSRRRAPVNPFLK